MKISKSNFLSVTDELKENSQKHNLSKIEMDLYHDEYNVVEKLIRVKRFSLPNKGEKWKIFEDNKLIHTIEGTKLTLKEREFLRTVDGANWLLQQAKLGIKSFNSFKKILKEKLSH
jgi:hypothetical protein